jgi:imidazole glycerol-phosphate synthase subunit HisF
MNSNQSALCKRIIPCLDIKDGRVVKGIQFEEIKDAGDAVALAKSYASNGADELVFLDITATVEKRKTLVNLVKQVAAAINIPFTVGGGIASVDDVAAIIQSGADKISINTAAFLQPTLLTEISNRFGSQCVVVAIDTKKEQDGEWYVYLNGGRKKTNVTAYNWAVQAVAAGAGEILLTAMNNDGEKSGFAIDITNKISTSLSVPVIASGGAGKVEHFKEVFEQGHADAALAASIFHYNEISINQVKQYLQQQHIQVRL